ncbi:hypothetical protein LSAT2_013323 [Lamellibrachia satsuma]|nr:hypothetical protein LSAT2_013323 [Lamellibrachia satsuma]
MFSDRKTAYHGGQGRGRKRLVGKYHVGIYIVLDTEGNNQVIVQDTEGNNQVIVQDTEGNNQVIVQDTEGNNQVIVQDTEGNNQVIVQKTEGNNQDIVQDTEGNNQVIDFTSNFEVRRVHLNEFNGGRMAWCLPVRHVYIPANRPEGLMERAATSSDGS